jgi:hypothetical protein
MECDKNGDDGAVGPVQGDSCVKMALAGTARTCHCAFFPPCLDDTTICNGSRRKSCLRFKDKEHPSTAKAMAAREAFDATETGTLLIKAKLKKEAFQLEQKREKCWRQQRVHHV